MQPLKIDAFLIVLFFLAFQCSTCSAVIYKANWIQLNPSNPPPLVSNSPVACGPGTICMFSGNNVELNVLDPHLHKFTTTGGWAYEIGFSGTTVPSPRINHATTYRASDNTLFILGGQNGGGGGVLFDCWRYNFGASPSWTSISMPNVPPRQSHGMVTLSDNRIILFGGLNAAAKPLNDMWILTTDNIWTPSTVAFPINAPFAYTYSSDSILYILNQAGTMFFTSDLTTWTADPNQIFGLTPQIKVPPIAALGSRVCFNSHDGSGTFVFERGIGWSQMNSQIRPVGFPGATGLVSNGSYSALFYNGQSKETWGLEMSTDVSVSYSPTGTGSLTGTVVTDESSSSQSTFNPFPSTNVATISSFPSASISTSFPSSPSTSGPAIVCPYKCFNKCVQSLAECEQYDPAKQCNTAPNWFPCSKDGLRYVCQSVPCLSVCTGVQNVSCWNGECVASRTQCSPVPACPEAAPFRCSDGSCMDTLTKCPTVDCASPNVKCADGTCSPPGISCPAYDGCASTLPYLCPNGKCVTNATECRCGTDGWQCFDGRCVADKSMCRKPPSTQKPVEVELTIPVDQSFEVNVTLDSNYTQVLCKVILPVGSLTSYTSDDGANAIQIVRPVADSILRQTRHPSWSENTDPLTNLLSPALALTLSGYEEKTVTFTVPVTIQLSVYLPDNVDTSRICLAYITTDGQWECEDDKLIFTSSGGSLTAIGKTSHYTDFALLLQENEESSDVPNDRKDESVDPKVYIIIFVIAGVVVIVGGIGAAIWMKKKKKREDDDVNLSVELEQQ